MTAALLVLSWAWPLMLAALTPWAAARWLALLAPLPALAAALAVPTGSTLTIDWLLLGVHLQLDETARLFLLFGAWVWLLAGVSLAAETGAGAGRLRLFFLLAMAGNLLLVVAADMLAFYVGFALMGLSAYGLVTHRRNQHARRAGRVYLTWTLVGELALFGGMVLLASQLGSVRFDDLAGASLPPVAVALLLFGFGIKLALPGLHLWLPLAYPAAPALATAVLSGPMINAGLLGWLRFLPPGTPGLDAWASLLMFMGALGMALGVFVGLNQRDPRAVLAYSSVAKMGLVSLVFGSALAHPEAAAPVLAALVLFAVHHSLVKSALFLGLDAWERAGARTWLLALLAVPALALAGAPLTAGSAAKAALSEALAGAGLELLLGLSALGTALLMVRLLWLLQAQARTAGSLPRHPALPVALAAAGAALWLPFGPGELVTSGYMPILVALVLVPATSLLLRSLEVSWPPIPAGDLYHLLPSPGQLWRHRSNPAAGAPGADRLSTWIARIREPANPAVSGAGVLWLALCAVLTLALLWP